MLEVALAAVWLRRAVRLSAGPADSASGAAGAVEQVLRLYQEIYADFKVRGFREKLVEEHGIRLR